MAANLCFKTAFSIKSILRVANVVFFCGTWVVFQNLMLTDVTKIILRDIPDFACAVFGNHDLV